MHYCNKFVRRAWLSPKHHLLSASPHPWHPKLIRVQLGTHCGAVLFPELQQKGHWVPWWLWFNSTVEQCFSYFPQTLSPATASLWLHWGLSLFLVFQGLPSSKPLDFTLQTVPHISHTKLLFSSRDHCRGATNTTSKKIHHDCSYLISTAQIVLKHLIFLACAHLAPLSFPPEVSILRASNPSLWI